MAEFQNNNRRGKQLLTSQCAHKGKKAKETLGSGGETLCILIAKDLQKADKNSFVKNKLTFTKQFKGFLFLDFHRYSL